MREKKKEKIGMCLEPSLGRFFTFLFTQPFSLSILLSTSSSLHPPLYILLSTPLLFAPSPYPPLLSTPCLLKKVIASFMISI